MSDGLIDRAAKRAEWAVHALQGAADDLQQARAEGAPVDGQPNALQAEAQRVGELLEAIRRVGAAPERRVRDAL